MVSNTFFIYGYMQDYKIDLNDIFTISLNVLAIPLLIYFLSLRNNYLKTIANMDVISHLWLEEVRGSLGGYGLHLKNSSGYDNFASGLMLLKNTSYIKVIPASWASKADPDYYHHGILLLTYSRAKGSIMAQGFNLESVLDDVYSTKRIFTPKVAQGIYDNFPYFWVHLPLSDKPYAVEVMAGLTPKHPAAFESYYPSEEMVAAWIKKNFEGLDTFDVSNKGALAQFVCDNFVGSKYWPTYFVALLAEFIGESGSPSRASVAFARLMDKGARPSAISGESILWGNEALLELCSQDDSWRRFVGGEYTANGGVFDPSAYDKLVTSIITIYGFDASACNSEAKIGYCRLFGVEKALAQFPADSRLFLSLQMGL